MPKRREVKVTDQQWNVARALLVDGAADEVVASRMWVAVSTVRTHLKALYAATGTANRTELAIEIWSGDLDLFCDAHGSILLAVRQTREETV